MAAPPQPTKSFSKQFVDGAITIRSSTIPGLRTGIDCNLVELDDGRLGFASGSEPIRSIPADTWTARVDLVQEIERRTPTWAIVV
jgi:hypothetical protein